MTNVNILNKKSSHEFSLDSYGPKDLGAVMLEGVLENPGNPWAYVEETEVSSTPVEAVRLLPAQQVPDRPGAAAFTH